MKKTDISGLSKFCPSSLRGLHATLALEQGATTHAVAKGLGHVSIKTTERHYVQPGAIDKTRVQRVVELLRPTTRDTSLEAAVAGLSRDDRLHLDELLKRCA